MNVPCFFHYFPDESMMNKEQKHFYKYLEAQLCLGVYPSVESNIGYLFVYVYKLLKDWPQKGFENLYIQLLDLAEAYYIERKFASYCKFWSYDCLLWLNQYKRFLDSSEPTTPFGIETHMSNLRLNIEYQSNLPANPIDLFKMGNWRVTKIIRNYPGLFKEALMQCLGEVLHTEAWFERLIDELGPNSNKYPHILFQGAPINQPSINLHCYCFYQATKFLESYKIYFIKAENYVRKNIGLPNIGEGWVSETALYRAIEKAFPETHVIQHGRPDWLGLQHFDIWLPHWNIAVEYHGDQHFIPIDFFGGVVAFAETKKRDQRKVEMARKHGVQLIIVTENDSHLNIIRKIKSK